MNTSGAIALVFDFDDTLAPDSTTKLLAAHGIDTDHFWGEEAREHIRQGYDPTHAYLKLLLENIGPEKPLGELTNDGLREFGRTLDEDFYPGLPDLFDDLRKQVDNAGSGFSIEFHIISSGLEDVIRGSSVVNTNFRGVYGCLLAGDTPDGSLKYVRRAVTFSEKTRFLFEISKGVRSDEAIGNPLLVNKDVAMDARPIPFENIIYVGDGLTDIPCFSLVESLKGKAFGVLHKEKLRGKAALAAMLGPRRARSLNAPLYRREDDLGVILRTMVGTVCGEVLHRREAAR